jgi:1-aminocyclopropane-1-carboxylate deaminase/D-cysteine desulfhydrase-like pyridoxal-dependent ACC family enzyme
MGGSSPLGTVGYIRAALELRHQLFERNIDADAVFVSSGSGGTQAGLIAGKLLQDVQWRIIGISPSKPKAVIQERVRTNVAGVIDLLKLPVSFDPNQIEVRDDFIGPGYGVPTPAGVEAIRLVARTEGLLLDPVYTGKAMAGMIAAIRRGEFNRDQTLVFCMTGGIPALFALNREILALVEQE